MRSPTRRSGLLTSCIGATVGVLMGVGSAAAQPPPASDYAVPALDDAAQPSPPKPTKRTSTKPFTPETAPRWIVAATTPTAVPLQTPPPPRSWKPSKRWALTPVIGTDGVGADLSYLATRALVLRARGNWLGIKHGQTYDQVHYDGRLSFATGGLFVDLHPLSGFAHPLFVSAGAITGRRKASILATPQGSITYGGHTYTAAQVGTVAGAIRLPDTAPFLGAGWDNSFDTHGPIGFRFLAGVEASSRPSVGLTSTGGLLSATSVLQSDLATERARISAAADDLRFYPVVSTGLSFRF